MASYRIDSLEKNVSVIEDHQHASYRIDSLEILIGVICQMVLASYRIDSLEILESEKDIHLQDSYLKDS